jgi:sigma-B regulation protein RsbU (phosphoserine phosphatase)
MNRLLHGSTDVSNYATFFYAQFDELTGVLTYVNAGHNPPILVHTRAVSAPQAAARAANVDSGAAPDSTVSPRHSGPITIGGNVIRHLTRGGPMIGAFDDSVYQQQTLQLQPGDIMVAYTDGVTEAQNDFDEEFGEERLRDLIISSLQLSAAEITQKIAGEVRDWCGSRARQDDLTLVVMKVLG